MEEKNKKIDDAWKEKVEKEKLQGQEHLNPKNDGPSSAFKEGTYPKKEETTPSVEEAFPGEPDFSFFVTTLSVQAAIALGEIPNPLTKRKETNFSQGKLIIDTLAMLKEKTRGNLSTEEDSLIDNVLYELRMQYISKTTNKENT
jgi:hypothetical protein